MIIKSEQLNFIRVRYDELSNELIKTKEELSTCKEDLAERCELEEQYLSMIKELMNQLNKQTEINNQWINLFKKKNKGGFKK